MSSAKWRRFCVALTVLNNGLWHFRCHAPSVTNVIKKVLHNMQLKFCQNSDVFNQENALHIIVGIGGAMLVSGEIIRW